MFSVAKAKRLPPMALSCHLPNNRFTSDGIAANSEATGPAAGPVGSLPRPVLGPR